MTSIIALTTTITKRVTKANRGKIPDYLITEADAMLKDLNEVHEFWSKILVDGRHTKVEAGFSKVEVMNKVQSGKGMLKRLDVSIDIATQ